MMLTIAHFQGHHVDLLRTMMMTVLEMRVTAAKMGISTPGVGIIISVIIISIISSSSASSHHHNENLLDLHLMVTNQRKDKVERAVVDTWINDLAGRVNATNPGGEMSMIFIICTICMVYMIFIICTILLVYMLCYKTQTNVSQYMYNLDQFTKTFFWNFQSIRADLCYILMYKQMLEKAFCSNIAPSLSSGNHLFYKAEYMGRSCPNQVWTITFDWSALAT